MKKFSVRSIFSASLSLLFFLNPLASTNASSSFINVTAPAEVNLGQSFEINVEVAATPNTNYYLKARLGPEGGDLNKGRTYDENTGVWLTDTVAWDHFPSFTTNGDGVWSGKLKASFSPTAAPGPYLLVVRTKKVDADSFINSSPYQISLKEAAKTPEATPTPKAADQGQPILNEFMASPASGTEWVEIKNKGLGIADLSGWKIDDEPGKSTPQVLPASTFINPGSFLVVNFSSPKLNDSADQVRLLKPDDTVVETYAYEKPEKGRSFAKDSSGAWFIADPTPGAENPNPPTANGAVGASTNVNKTAAQEASAELAAEDSSAKLPVLGTATKSATIAAAVAAKNTLTKNSWFNFILGILGVLLITSAVLIVFKEPLLKLFKKFRPADQALPQA